jgi:hypothetical protein
MITSHFNCHPGLLRIPVSEVSLLIEEFSIPRVQLNQQLLKIHSNMLKKEKPLCLLASSYHNSDIYLKQM